MSTHVDKAPASPGSSSPEYQLLGRLQQDCEYYLGNGKRARKHLWAGGEVEQIRKMKELFEGLPAKPEWISLDDIARYELAMMSGQWRISSLNDALARPTDASSRVFYVNLVRHGEAAAGEPPTVVLHKPFASEEERSQYLQTHHKQWFDQLELTDDEAPASEAPRG